MLQQRMFCNLFSPSSFSETLHLKLPP